MLLTILPYLYASIALVAIAGYLPQIYKLARSHGDSGDISLLTWLIWLSTWLISLLYGMLILHDVRFCLVAAVNIAGHVAIIGLTFYNRHYRNKIKEQTQAE